MSRKIKVGLFVAVLIATMLFVTPAFAQETDATLEVLYEQIYELRRQVVERHIELGNLEESEGNIMLENMEDRFLRRSEEDSGRFFGMWGKGWSEDGSRGYGHCWR